MLAYLFQFPFSIHLLIVLSSEGILVDSATFSRLIKLYSLRLRSWDRVQDRFVGTIDQIDMDS